MCIFMKKDVVITMKNMNTMKKDVVKVTIMNTMKDVVVESTTIIMKRKKKQLPICLR